MELRAAFLPLQIFGGQKRMSAIALLDISSAEQLHQRMLALAELGRGEWALLHPQSLQVSALRSDRRADQAIGIIDRRANQINRETGSSQSTGLSCLLPAVRPKP